MKLRELGKPLHFLAIEIPSDEENSTGLSQEGLITRLVEYQGMANTIPVSSPLDPHHDVNITSD